VTNGVTGGSWISTDTSILSGSGGSSCTMTGKKAGTVYVYYKANGQESNRIQVQVRGV
jgi:nicotinamide mononucleotide (NMN) deamidase PncC